MKSSLTRSGRANALRIISLANIVPENKFNEFVEYLAGYQDGLAAARANESNQIKALDLEHLKNGLACSIDVEEK